jgi:hypothetical protein
VSAPARGLVFDVRRGVLHAADCYWAASARSREQRLRFDELDDAIMWLTENRGREREDWRRCDSCRAEPAGGRVTAMGMVGDAAAGLPVHGYVVHGDAKRVEAWSHERLASPPDGWLVAFRNDLRAALRGLAPDEGEVLSASYAGPDACDLEETLVLTPGADCLAAPSRYGRRLERHDEDESPPDALPQAAHHYVYELLQA